MLTLIALSAAAVAAAASPPPHIIFALTDDLGGNFPGYHNDAVSTPTLDHLAIMEGVRLNYDSWIRQGQVEWIAACHKCFYVRHLAAEVHPCRTKSSKLLLELHAQRLVPKGRPRSVRERPGASGSVRESTGPGYAPTRRVAN